MSSDKFSSQLTSFISLVPKHLRKFVKHGIFLIPNEALIEDYQNKKHKYLESISSSKQPSANSMHKYTSTQPISNQDLEAINRICAAPLAEYCSMYLKQYDFNNKQPTYHGGFAITYNEGHKGLAIHKDDSQYTVNLCLSNKSQGNQVIFLNTIQVQMIQDYCCIHPGGIPHQTEQLKKGQRINIILWYK